MKFLDPTNDIAFKKIFGNENKKNILISFLNSLLELPAGKKILSVDILNPYQVPKIAELKNTILDVRAKDERGVSYIVEMQIAKVTGFQKRVLYYTSKTYVNQIEMGEDYPHLNQVVFLGILDFTIFESEHYLSNHLILNKNTKEHHLKDFAFTFVELPKFMKSEQELNSIEDKWIYFLKNAKNLEIVPETLQEENILDAFHALEKFGWSKEELEIYDTVSMYRQDERGRIEEAREEGAHQKVLEMALRMLEEGMAAEIIERVTGLTRGEIEEMQ